METDRKGKPILNGARANCMARKLHNVKVAQSRGGWTMAHVLKAIDRARAGIVHNRIGGAR